MQAEGHFTARCQEQHVGFGVGSIDQNVGALSQPRRGRELAAVDDRQRLARQHQCCRRMVQLHDDLPGLRDFVGIGRTQDHQTGDGPQRGELFDGLMCGTVLADADRIVREDINGRQFHQSAQPDRRFGVVAEDQERRAVGAHLDEGHAVEDRGHRVFADAEVQITAAGRFRLEVAGAIERQPRLGRGRQVRGAAHQPRHILGEGIEDFAGGIARRHALRVRRESRQAVVPAFRQLTVHHAIEMVCQLWIFGAILFHTREPGIAQLFAAPAHAVVEMIVYAIRYIEFRILRPTVVALGQTHFLFAERFAVRGAGVLLVWSAVRNVAVHDDERRPIARTPEGAEGSRQHPEVVRITHARDVPTVADEARRDVIAEG